MRFRPATPCFRLPDPSFKPMESLTLFWQATGISHLTWGALLMLGVGGVVLAIAVIREFEPLFLFAMGFAIILTHLPGSPMANPGGLFSLLYDLGVRSALLPALLFLGLGILADFGPLIAMPSLLLVGAVAQLGVFCTLLAALAMNNLFGLPFALTDAAAIGMIGGANPANVIFFADRLAPDLLGSIVVALYAGTALLPRLQPFIAGLLTTRQERQVVMPPPRPVSRWERMLFPLVLLLPCLLFLPAVAPLLGLLAFGNLLKESGLLARISVGLNGPARVGFLPMVTLMLGLAVGGRFSAEGFLSWATLGILCLALLAFVLASVLGVLAGKWLYRVGNGLVNPLVGVAGVAVVPLTARMAGRLGMEESPDGTHSADRLLGYAVGVNMAGVIGSVVTAGILLAVLGG
ncbi:MAG: sodium ion-translocating decarboxylase subunit beta [Magnetococcus sp. XQGC-1]